MSAGIDTPIILSLSKDDTIILSLSKDDRHRLRMAGPRTSRVGSKPWVWLSVLLFAALLLTGCQRKTETVSAVATSTALSAAATATQTDEPVTPTLTAVPTHTPAPTATFTPANTATPTVTVAPKTIRDTDNILLLGMDQRPGEGVWRTDTIMVAAIDYEANQVGIVSIPRDLWVEIPGYEYQYGRINQADFQGEYNKYPGGGPKLAADIISATLGIPTQHWVRLRLEALPELVDALGGVTVTLDCRCTR